MGEHDVLSKVAPDVLRILASGYPDEATETKMQVRMQPTKQIKVQPIKHTLSTHPIKHTLSTHPINTSYYCTLLLHLINLACQPTLSTQPIITPTYPPSQRTLLSTHPPFQPTLSTYPPLNTPTLSTHPFNLPSSQHTHPFNTPFQPTQTFQPRS